MNDVSCTLVVNLDTSPLRTFIQLFLTAVALKENTGFVSVYELGFEWARIESDYSQTGALTLVAYPSDEFLRFAARINTP